MKKQIVAISALTLTVFGGALLVPNLQPVEAAQVIGTVTMPDDDKLNRLSITAIITKVDRGVITFKDTQDGNSYTAGLGSRRNPAREKIGILNVGDIIKLEGVKTEGDNARAGHNFMILSLNGNTIREVDASGNLVLPKWRGQGLNEDGTRLEKGEGLGRRGVGNGDGTCDQI